MHDWTRLARSIKDWGRELGFDAIGITGTDLGEAERELNDWLAADCHGEMDYMATHGTKRSRPAELVPGTRAVIAARMNYRPPVAPAASAEVAAISRYALGRDYHKLLRARLQKLADRIVAEVGEFGYRVFTDSAPVMEVALAAKAGLGWRGKHTLLLSRQAGSWFFLGEIYVDLPLPPDAPATDHCGTCRACLDACPTDAFLAPYRLDARRCISYLTIELKGAIPEPLRPLLGNRIYGCDDCQDVCPWNREAPMTREPDFLPRHALDTATLIELFAWDEAEFNEKLAGSAIRRIGHERWLRNIAIALGNAPSLPELIAALEARREDSSALVREHVAWALNQHPHPPAPLPEKGGDGCSRTASAPVR
ncbi:tRNA epoxyqueuosine(34) reductase QueG [Sulfurisoma sediminicola]|uniref:Epoxyqueuosine reductase n=1 Tax=Sulfurisoma sediminicola TaxID=1381557 RepID=A0A497XAL8_9PROT|nr:tRNA epoxyqueuosine(34) reductase QueG [Sulfurisoma sediminicola]RLJ63595.1 epoxyqueuosine reductase [Sulfurisoma sediminicola]